MKILLVCMEYDYGQKNRGRSYEYYNLYDSLKVQHDVILFDFMQETVDLGKVAMNQKLVKIANNGNFDIAIFVLFTDQLNYESIDYVRKHTKTLCFFHDDTWRFDYVRSWAPHFDFFTSSDPECKIKYASAGIPHVIHFPFGANERLYHPLNIPKRYDVSFIGGWHPVREWTISRLRKAGFQVKVAGYGWQSGIISHEEMIQIFNESRINLNLSNSRSWDARMLLKMRTKGLQQLQSPKIAEQIKARHFEINACGSFQLSYYVHGLEAEYKLGKEIGIYLDQDDMIEKVRYYLENDELRESIALSGFKRILSDHTFTIRFKRVFKDMGFK